MSCADFTEDALVEQPAIELFRELGWETANCFHEFDHGRSPLSRESKGDVVLVQRLRAALETLNPTLPSEAIHQAIEELARGRSTMSAAAANREVYRLVKDGVKVDWSRVGPFSLCLRMSCPVPPKQGCATLDPCFGFPTLALPS
ncbi:MAG: type I restriction endonuclease [Terriglobia bacterium]